MTVHTSPLIGTAYEPGVGLCAVEQLRPGSPTMRLIPLVHHSHYSTAPLLKHRDLVKWRSGSMKGIAA